ncbi:hypothetical protein niasHT_038772 [Heterodera trifolii]|uniref:DNA-directed DNA polymerase n=1 Tax=Heterodera trifolii TaxID=157864 RepID=A0ABD2ISQ9_9BILA
MRSLFELEHQHGCELHVIWGCQWKERLRHDHELKQRYEAVFTPCPLDPRNDALRGGRTEPFKLHHVCADDEEVLCIDIVSLYPYVMKVNPFPVGNPMVLTREVLLHPSMTPLPWTCPKTTLFGASCSSDERFTFPLCGLCADRRQQRPCRHGDDKRSWVCAYTHVELNKALQLGYVVTDLFEVWNYAEWDDTLFSTTSTASSVSNDTDSIYYVNKIGAPCVPEGEALGQMKREHVDRRIVEFVAGCPKNYGIRYTARDGTDERANLKIRSFRLSYATLPGLQTRPFGYVEDAPQPMNI